jgi:Zn-dependent M16 (insulinase) family peptidase
MDPETNSHFRKIQVIKPDYAVAVITQYESLRTGLRVAAVDRQSPMMTGGFALATEIHDESGAPHTLEHLVFMVLNRDPLRCEHTLTSPGFQELPVCRRS